MTLARVRRPTCEARPAAWKASPSTYTPPWKYRTTWRGSIPSIVISAVGTPPSAAAVTGTSGARAGPQNNHPASPPRPLGTMLTGEADLRTDVSSFVALSVVPGESLRRGVVSLAGV